MSRRDEPRALGLRAGEWSCGRIEPQDPEWPAPLAEIPDAPEAIYVDGEPLGLAPAAVALVGTRRPTSAGLEAARAFAAGLAQAGFVVVSVLAEGLAAAAPDVAVVLDDLAPALVYPATPTSQAAEVALSDPERAVLELLDDAPVPLESLARNNGLEPGALGLGLSKLEVRGLAVRRSGGYEITSRGARVRAALDGDGEAS